MLGYGRGKRGRTIRGLVIAVGAGGALALAPPVIGTATAQVGSGARGPWYDLAGGYTKGDATYDLDVCYVGPDPVRSIALEQDGEEIWHQDILPSPAARGAQLDDDACDSGSLPTSVDSTQLSEGAHTYVTDAWSTTSSEPAQFGPWTVYVDRTGPVFESPFSATGRPSESGKIWVYWDDADDPALADGNDGSGLARYEARLPGGSWVPATATGMQIDEPSSPTTIEIRAYDNVGNVSATVSSPITMAPTDPEDSVPLGFTVPQPADDQYDFDAAEAAGTLTQDRQWELDEMNGTDDEQPGLASFADGQARVAPESVYPKNGKHDPDIRYRCVGPWAPIQAGVSGFVIGNCGGNDWVLGYKAKVYPLNTAKEDYPGSFAEGLGWEAVSPPAAAHFDGCGWINILRRLYVGQSEPPSDLENRCDEGPTAQRRHHANYGEEEYIKPFSGNRIGGGGGDEPNTVKYRGLYIWSTNTKSRDHKEKAGYKWQPHFANPNKTCDAYANINPYKSGQHVLASEKTWSVHDESQNIRIRYIARFRADNEAGDPKWWVMVQSVYPADRLQNWGFVAADCLFSG